MLTIPNFSHKCLFYMTLAIKGSLKVLCFSLACVFAASTLDLQLSLFSNSCMFSLFSEVFCDWLRSVFPNPALSDWTRAVIDWGL